LCRTEAGTEVMVVGLFLLVNVVREMRRVPDHHVLVDDVFPVDEAVEPGLERRSRGDCPVVDLRLAEPQYPHVAAPEGISNAVVRPWDQRVGVAGLRVPDLPPSAALWVPEPRGLELVGVPVLWGGRWAES
jgi:hypothetical protein